MWPHLMIAQAAADGGWFVQLIPFILIFGVFWFLVIRPQQKRQKEHTNFLGSLKTGDRVVTAGGLFGTIEKVDGQIISLRVSRDSKVKVMRGQIEGSQDALLAADDEDVADEADEEDAAAGRTDDDTSGDDTSGDDTSGDDTSGDDQSDDEHGPTF